MKFQKKCLQESVQWSAVQKIQTKIRENGFVAMLAGGAVRDAFLGVIPHDLDVVTDASIEDLKKIFNKIVFVGESFGVLRVIEDDQTIEVAQFRKESDYEDGRHPSLISSATPEEDAHRRDFTVNALFYDFSTEKVLDYVGGIGDLEQKILRCVGDTEVRFKEDHLRILRAVRFEAQLGFSLSPEAEHSCKEMSQLTAKLSKERIQDELLKILLGPRPTQALDKFWQLNLLQVLFVERAKNYLDVKSELKILFENEIKEKDLALALFMWKVENPEKLFVDFRWPKKSEKNIIRVIRIFNDFKKFLQMRLGEQLLVLQDPLFRRLMTLAEPLFSDLKKPIETLKSKWSQLSVDESLPAPVVKSEDLAGEFQGKELGASLKEAYLLQLENPDWKKDRIVKVIYSNQSA